MIKKVFFGCFVFLSFSLTGYSSDVSTVFNLRAFGGNYSQSSQAGSYNGDLSIDFVPAVKFNDKLSLLPALYINYNGIKDVSEVFVGGDPLFMQSANYNVSIRPVYKLNNNLKLKLKVGYLNQLIVETKDETWGKGAFDYSKVNVGAGIGFRNMDFSYNMYTIVFPNYSSLASQTTYQIGAGKDILDFAANEISVFGKMSPSGSFVIDWALDYTMKSFADQKIQNQTGAYSLENRADNVTIVNIGPSVALLPTGPVTVYAGLSVGYTINSSNQNVYDAVTTDYIPKFYDFTETVLSPMFSFSFNTVPMRFDLTYDVSTRNYAERLNKVDTAANDGTYAYSTDKMYLKTNTLSLSVTYPMSEKLSIKGSMKTFDSSSNNKSTADTALYNYTAMNIFAGITYEY